MCTLPNYMRTLLNCMQMLRNCKRVRSNYIAKNPNKTAQIFAIAAEPQQFPHLSLLFCLTWETTLLESARFWLARQKRAIP
jgi:hypothetical protein